MHDIKFVRTTANQNLMGEKVHLHTQNDHAMLYRNACSINARTNENGYDQNLFRNRYDDPTNEHPYVPTARCKCYDK
jgi:hypothetical protein